MTQFFASLRKYPLHAGLVLVPCRVIIRGSEIVQQHNIDLRISTAIRLKNEMSAVGRPGRILVAAAVACQLPDIAAACFGDKKVIPGA